mgnify:CR=1 FL=1
MNQSEFNKQELFESWIKTAKEQHFDFKYVLDEVKRNKWNVNLTQVTKISNDLNTPINIILWEAEEMNILNVPHKLRKLIQKEKKHVTD